MVAAPVRYLHAYHAPQYISTVHWTQEQVNHAVQGFAQKFHAVQCSKAIVQWSDGEFCSGAPAKWRLSGEDHARGESLKSSWKRCSAARQPVGCRNVSFTQYCAAADTGIFS